MLYVLYRDLDNGARERLFITNSRDAAEIVKLKYEEAGVTVTIDEE